MKKLFIILIVSIALFAIAIGIVSWLSWQPQSWYAPPDYSRPEVKKLADRAEYRLNEEFHKIRPVDAVWRIRITDEAMNAWLSGRLEGWLTHDRDVTMPPELHGPQVHITVDGIWVAAMIDFDNESTRPIALRLWSWIDEGKLFVEPTALRLGKIPVPISLFNSVISGLQEKTNGVESIAPLIDDREVEIQAISLEDGALVLTCQTLLPQ
jgi:hypothetical protein